MIDVALERFKHDQDQYAELVAARRQATRDRTVAQAKALLRRRGLNGLMPTRSCVGGGDGGALLNRGGRRAPACWCMSEYLPLDFGAIRPMHPRFVAN